MGVFDVAAGVVAVVDDVEFELELALAAADAVVVAASVVRSETCDGYPRFPDVSFPASPDVPAFACPRFRWHRGPLCAIATARGCRCARV